MKITSWAMKIGGVLFVIEQGLIPLYPDQKWIHIIGVAAGACIFYGRSNTTTSADVGVAPTAAPPQTVIFRAP